MIETRNNSDVRNIDVALLSEAFHIADLFTPYRDP